MNSAMSIDHQTPAPSAVRPPSRIKRRIQATLLVIAAIELMGGLSNIATLFGDMSEVPGPGFGGVLVKANIATRPFLALAALIFAVKNHLRGAIIALAAIILMTWLNYMPSVVLHGFELRGPAWFETPIQIIAFPLIAACAIALAARNQRLVAATVLVSVPTLYAIGSVLAFAIGVSIYGF